MAPSAPFAPPPVPDAARKRAWEVGPPAYLQRDLDAYRKGLAETPYLSGLQRDFYATYFSARAEKLFGVAS